MRRHETVDELRVSESYSFRRCSGVGLGTGGLVGFACGLYLLAWNPVPGALSRVTLLLFVTAAYGLVIGLPVALAWKTIGRWLGSRSMGDRGGAPSALDAPELGAPTALWQTAVSLGAISILSLVLQLIQDLIGYRDRGLGWALLKAADGMGFISVFIVVFAMAVLTLVQIRNRVEGNYLAVSSIALPMLFWSGNVIFDESRAVRRQGTTSREIAAEARPDFGGHSGRKIAVVGFDGLDDRIMQPLIRRGEMPTFAELYRQGTYRPLKTLPYGLSPPIWATVSTGVSPSSHGIHGFEKRRLWGTSLDLGWVRRTPDGIGTVGLFRGLQKIGLIRPGLVDATDATAPTLWRIAGRAGLATSVVGWMTTWPAEPINGTLISDRAFTAANRRRGLAAETAQIAGGPVRLGGTGHGNGGAEEQDLCSPVPSCLELLYGSSSSETYKNPGLDVAEFHLAENRFYLDVFQRMPEIPNRDFVFFYTHLPDFVNHRMTASELEKVRAGIYDTATEKMVRRVYMAVDETLQAVLDTLGADTTVLVVSDHGVDLLVEGRTKRVDHALGPDGVFFFRSGTGVEDLRRLLPSRVDLYDLAPTVLDLAGLPIPPAMSGRSMSKLVRGELGLPVLQEASETESLQQVRDRDRSSESEAQSTATVDEQLLERLRALGYIG